jgi:hypothetical protein
VANTVVLALAAAIYPTILAGVIVILAQPRPRPLLFGFLLGGMTVSIVAGVAIVKLIHESGHAVDVRHTTRPGLDIAAGLLSLWVAWLLWTRRTAGLRRLLPQHRPHLPRTTSAKPWTERVLGRGSVWLAIITGALLNLPGLWYLAALADIAQDHPASYQLLQILVFNLIMFTLAEIPLVMFVLDEESARRRVSAFSDRIHGHRREVGIGLALVVGVYLLTKGVVLLLA